jgi:hypothetical protein
LQAISINVTTNSRLPIVGIIVGMGFNVLLKILWSLKVLLAHLALEWLEGNVNTHM